MSSGQTLKALLEFLTLSVAQPVVFSVEVGADLLQNI